QQWWFRAAVLVTLVATIMALLQARQRRIEERIHAVIEERTRLAREFHDTLLQGFTGIALQLRAAMIASGEHAGSKLGTLVTMAERTLMEARQAVWDMRGARSARAEDMALAKRLDHAARELIGEEPIDLDFAIAGERRSLEPNVEDELVRIA